MRSTISQLLVVLVVSMVKGTKRSPLEVGFVTFTETPHLKIGNHTAAVVAKSHSEAHTHHWVPGHVRDHSFIPAHLAHVYLPTHLLLARTVDVIEEPDIYPYRSHLGGFGIGADVGGQGAGHGYHVVFNL